MVMNYGGKSDFHLLILIKIKGRGDDDTMRVGGYVVDESHPLDAKHQGGHIGSMWLAVRLRQVPLCQQVRRHAGGAARASAEAVEQGSVAVPPQGRLRHHQDPLPLLILHNGTYLQLKYNQTMHDGSWECLEYRIA